MFYGIFLSEKVVSIKSTAMDALKYFGELYGCKMPADGTSGQKDKVEDELSNKGR